MNSVTLEALRRLPETISFPSEEETVFAYWKQQKVFEACLKQSKDKPRYTFYDGPPFAAGLPHYGHILAGTVKDIVTRYAHQLCYRVERRFGWNCHGVPIEYGIDKILNVHGPEDAAKMGIRKYNDECRKIVMRYADVWEREERDHRPDGPLNRLLKRLQDAIPLVHGVHLVGFQAAIPEGADLPGRQGDALLDGLHIATVELRVRSELQRGDRSGRVCVFPDRERQG